MVKRDINFSSIIQVHIFWMELVGIVRLTPIPTEYHNERQTPSKERRRIHSVKLNLFASS